MNKHGTRTKTTAEVVQATPSQTYAVPRMRRKTPVGCALSGSRPHMPRPATVPVPVSGI